MRMAIAVAVVVAAAAPAWALGWEEDFDYPDGSFPDWWEWTGDPRGGGAFLVYDGAFTHVDGGYVYYVRTAWGTRENLGAVYDFRVKDSNWVFAWRISDSDPMAGRCVWLSHDDLSGTWAYTLAEISWETLDPVEYPDGQYMWHNGTVLRSVQRETPGPLAGWHYVWVDDFVYGQVEVWVDGEQIFDEAYEFIGEGFQGLGCVGEGEMTPAFDFMTANWPDAVEPRSWSVIKALFR